MRIVRLSGLLGCLISAACAFAEVQVIDGKKYECRDGMCYQVEDDDLSFASGEGVASPLEESARIAQGYMRAEEFIAFLEGKGTSRDRLVPERGLAVLLLLVLLGGLAMNLTPCVLPMVPINLMIIGRSAGRGAAYGLGIAIAYGLLGVGAAVGGLAFGDIQGSPWFNAAVAVVFVGLALALFEVFFIDLSRFRPTAPTGRSNHPDARTVRQLFFPFFMGGLSAVLAGACVAPILISVLVLTADLVAKGSQVALFLPFVMGLGMALPWPFAGAGMKVLPRPGGWMKWVNKAFGVMVLGFAAWYGWLAWKGWSKVGSSVASGEGAATSLLSLSQPASLVSSLKSLPRPILVDCWATWCKNCAAMEREMAKPEVQEGLKPFTVIKLQAEDISELRKLKGFESIRGLPAFVIFE